jgi:hypothetical protein
LTYPSEKYESQLGLLFPIYGKMKNIPNHQPVMFFVNDSSAICDPKIGGTNHPNFRIPAPAHLCLGNVDQNPGVEKVKHGLA